MNTRRLMSILIVLVAVAAILGLGGWGFSRSGWGMMGGGYGMMGDYGVSYESGESGESISNEEATAVAQNVIAGYRNPDLEVAEIMAFSNHFYVQAREQSTGRYAFEFLIDRGNGRTHAEPGPNMMWNTKYGHMSWLRWLPWVSSSGEMSISREEARKIAQEYLARTRFDLVVDDETDAFYGYYTLHTLRDGKIAGMLSVNGSSGRVWMHTWHGTFLGMVGEPAHAEEG